jgi:hypothetical protein
MNMNIGRKMALALVGSVAITGCAMSTGPDGKEDGADPVAEVAQASSTTVIYGVVTVIKNGYPGGGFLDVRDAGCQGNELCVSTSTGMNRDQNSGSWQILSAQGKPLWDQVLSGDMIYLENTYSSDGYTNGGYLDARGSGCQENDLCVSTATSDDRDSGSGTWQIIAIGATGAPVAAGTPVAAWQTVWLANQYEGNGGYLDVRDAGCQGNDLCVSTSATQDRDTNSTHWTIFGPTS